MDVSTVSGNGVRIQSPSVAGSTAKATAHKLQKQTPAPANSLDVLGSAIGALESGRSLEMHYDKDIGMVVVQVVSGQDGSIVCQIPPEEIVSAMKSFSNYLKAIREGV